jgi:transcription antitermination factor NusG
MQNRFSEQADANQPWYALHVRSRHEKTVFAQLEAKQFKALLPLYKARNRWRDRWKVVELPLFPGYVFCSFHPGNHSPIVATSGVIDIVRIGSVPAAVDATEIEAIRRAASSPLPIQPCPTLIIGRRVVINDGPLVGVSGTLIEVRNGPRLLLSVELLRRSVLVEIAREWASPYEPVDHSRKTVQGVMHEAGSHIQQRG